jgi:hypothetical protein
MNRLIHPYTNQPERLWSFSSMLNVVEVCLVAFEILKKLKGIYEVKSKQRY